MTPASLFNSRCDIETALFSKDQDSGQSRPSWQAAASNVPCRLRWRAQSERLSGKTRWLESDYVLYLKWRAVEPLSSRIKTGGRVFTVTGAENIGGAGRYAALYLREVCDEN
ncbi:MAG: hypothetical protein WC421_03490 [Elusimicrobiales bacterium]